MSSYLIFKKGNTQIAAFQNCNPIYRFFHTKKYETWEEIGEKEINYAIESCKNDIELQKKQIQIQEEIISHLTDVEDIRNAVYDKSVDIEDLDFLQETLAQLYFIQNIESFEAFDVETNKEYKEPLYILKD